jgi:hypothetical protein
MPLTFTELIDALADRNTPLTAAMLKTILPNATDQELATQLTAGLSASSVGSRRVERFLAFPRIAPHAIDLLVKPGSTTAWTYKIRPQTRT